MVDTPKQPSAQPADIVIHAMLYGSTLCRKAGVPRDWESNHRWIMAAYCDPSELTCTACRSAYDVSMKKTMPGWRDDDPRTKKPVPKPRTEDML